MTDDLTDWLHGKDPHASRLLREVRGMAREAGPDVTERLSKSLIGWSGARSFATAYVKGQYLELSIDLTREVSHPRLRTAFRTTKAVVTHRFTFGPEHSLDSRIRTLLAEAFRTVGPGFRRKAA